MTIRAGEGLHEDKTYAIPVAISDQSSDITIKDEDAKHCIYRVSYTHLPYEFLSRVF